MPPLHTPSRMRDGARAGVMHPTARGFVLTHIPARLPYSQSGRGCATCRVLARPCVVYSTQWGKGRSFPWAPPSLTDSHVVLGLRAAPFTWPLRAAWGQGERARGAHSRGVPVCVATPHANRGRGTCRAACACPSLASPGLCPCAHPPPGHTYPVLIGAGNWGCMQSTVRPVLHAQEGGGKGSGAFSARQGQGQQGGARLPHGSSPPRPLSANAGVREERERGEGAIPTPTFVGSTCVRERDARGRAVMPGSRALLGLPLVRGLFCSTEQG
jgi:hypothetical protein